MNNDRRRTQNETLKLFLILLLINAAVLLLLVSLCYPRYEVNDDNGIIAIVSGVYGTPDAHMVYSNYVLGLLLSSLYKLSATVPWYAVIYYGLMWISFSCISFIITKRKRSNVHLAFMALVILSGQIEYCLYPTFTKTAAIIGIAGSLLIFDGMRDDAFSILQLISGAMLFIFAFMIRGLEAFAVAAVAIGILVFVVMHYVEIHDVKQIKARIKQGVILAASIIAVIIVLMIADYAAYNTPEWRNYEKYNELRANLLDYGFPDYERNKELYDELGIDAETFSLYTGWDFYDSERFTVEVMQKLVDAKDRQESYSGSIMLDSFGLYQHLSEYKILYILLGIVLAVIITRPINKKELFAIGCSAIVLVLLFTALLIMGRWDLCRVNFGILYTAAIVTLYILCESEIKLSRTNSILLICIVGAIASYCYGPTLCSYNYYSEYDARKTRQSIVDDVIEDQEHIYFCDAWIDIEDSYFVFDARTQQYAKNICYLGGWETNCPLQNDILRRYSFDNPYRALVENENALLIDGQGNFNDILNYIRKYYAPEAKAQCVKSYGNYNVYKITSNQKE